MRSRSCWKLYTGQDCGSRNKNISNKSKITKFTIANLKGLGLVRGSGKSSVMTSNWLKLSAAAGNTIKLTLGKALNMEPGYNLVLQSNWSVFPLVKASAGLRKHKRLNRIKITTFTVNQTWKCSLRVFSKDTFALQEKTFVSRENKRIPVFCLNSKPSGVPIQHLPEVQRCSIEPESHKSSKTQTPYQGILSLQGTLGYINTWQLTHLLPVLLLGSCSLSLHLSEDVYMSTSFQ